MTFFNVNVKWKSWMRMRIFEQSECQQLHVNEHHRSQHWSWHFELYCRRGRGFPSAFIGFAAIWGVLQQIAQLEAVLPFTYLRIYFHSNANRACTGCALPIFIHRLMSFFCIACTKRNLEKSSAPTLWFSLAVEQVH